MENMWCKKGYLLRLARLEDALPYYLQNYCPLDKQVAHLTGCKEVFTKEEVITFFEKALKATDRYWFLLVAPDKRIVGEGVINEIDWDLRKANFRIAILQATARNQGLGTWMTEILRDFAFENLKLHRLELSVYSFNKRAQKVYTKLGFKQEGCLRDVIKNQGQYADEIIMALLEDEWAICKTSDIRNQ